ncbi:cysteine--tRNA ligase [Candidatus Protochlamydia amoebophila]|uniref:Cysteine--tRNA ligase n=1 Tax=Candidatus Protochlamydia amoebophila TaxID=362787 RepID=A0A0C1H8X1_9BACT|nr:cysteine--tRNA ligase [Candidatus Protochlamydia amoebophila]KIC71328.1 Cysteine--tRNA ligase [Candidatus Protochlamydia amoebophila]
MNEHALKNIPLRLYNTAERQKQELKPIKGNHIQLYTCGPTVYHYAHIGNFRTYIFEDLLRRTIQFFGFSITQVMNLTDVDDKTIRGAIAKGITLDEYTKPYKDAFFEDLKTLNIQSAEYYPAATDYIPAMIEMIKVLLDKKVAYKGGDGSIYYAINQFPRYGCLSHLHLEDLQAGASERVAADEYEKEHVADFVLWKSYDPERDGQIYWESPFGLGRPGWHLECSAMAMHLLGETIDIHVGGIDNMFPHHENEIAQSEACSGKKFVNLWMHAEHLVVDQKKMSKSLGNFYTLRDLLNKGFTGIQVRYLLLQTHYKTQLNFTFQGVESVKSSLQRLNDFIQRIYNIQTLQSDDQVDLLVNDALIRFAEALADDLNISSALAAIFDFVREINCLCDVNQVSQKEAETVINLMKKFDTILGVLTFDKREESIPEDLQEAFAKRQQARQEKNWRLSDELRDFIHQRGYLIEDTPQGTRLKKQ